MEHLSTFGFSRDPFANDPQLDFWLETPSARACMERLGRALSQGKGLCVLTGAGGLGKTMLVRQLLESLEEEVYEVALLVPVPGVSDGAWILDRFARHIGVEAPSGVLAELLGQIYERLAIVREEGRHAVLILDEAQVLAEEGLLRNLRGLLNLEYEEKRLLSLVLVGLPALAGALDSEAALASRVELRMRLEPMDVASAATYLEHRIAVAGGERNLFEAGAREALVKHAGGNPRQLNTLADAALFEAHLAGRPKLRAEDVERALAELSIPSTPDAPSAPAEGRAIQAPVPEPTPAPDVRSLESPDDPLELGEVVADETDPAVHAEPALPEETGRFGSAAMGADSHRLPDPSRADSPPGSEPTRPAAAAPALVDAEQSDGELDDLFAEIVED